MATVDAAGLRACLLDAAVKCSERCLYQSAKWAAELLTSVPSTDDITPTEDNDDLDSPMEYADAEATPNPIISSQNLDPREALLEAREAPKFLLAKTFFDCREFDRCAAVFLPPDVPLGLLHGNPKVNAPTTPQKGKGKNASHSPAAPTRPRNKLPKMSQKSLFLALYAKYMAGEKRKNEESEMVLGPADGGTTVNRELADLAKSLEGWFLERQEKGLEEKNQGWLEYLYGIILAKGKNDKEAKTWLLRSVHQYPWNWGAWLELNDLVENMEELQGLSSKLPQNCMALMFYLHCSQENYQTSEETHRQLSALEDLFPESSFLKTQRALLLYHSKDFEEAASLFTALLHTDPYRLDALDHYSNILYVMSARPQLAFLAQLATAVDKFRPETCCVVGNYYALKSEHEKACMYFRRALTLDRNFLSAWTLMGHEYVEMKNTHAAIESYRRAVDVNRKDYRAWYGLGQAYEVLEMAFYALFYFQKAASLRPFDPKLWQAVGSCYAKMGRPMQSIKALKRALVAGSYFESISPGASVNTSFTSSQTAHPAGSSNTRRVMDPETLHQIATMYERLGEMDECAAYMELVIAQETGTSPEDEEDESNSENSDGDESTARVDASKSGTAETGPTGTGIGVTQTTSRARLWLAKWTFAQGNDAGLRRAYVLAEELCQDGMEVEEAKGIMRDVRGRRDGVGV